MLAKREYDPLTNEERSQAIGFILVYLRKKNGLSQGELCQRLRINKQTYANYESGRHTPKIETLMQLAYFYDVTMDFITGKSLFGIDKKFDGQALTEVLNNITAEQLEDKQNKFATMMENFAFLSVQMKQANELMAAAPDAKQYLEEQFKYLYDNL